ncbi:microtubule associated protein [Rickenella mellea]|uniref:Microtubule associated protein n=1 Tax=Rickenella mellea TaxID=50990 RepID=A0A4Y7QII8_9AGAM|nr:microtubule associated protein [Rickenella mellea]
MDGPPPQEEDFSQLPIADRLSHKNWKARLSGYEQLIKTFQNTTSDTDPAFNTYKSHPDVLKKLVTDTNAVAQEKGVEAVVAFVKFAGESAAKSREVVLPALVDKCFGSTRSGTKGQAIELVLQYVEVENGGAGVVGDILPGLAAKQPKVVATSVTALKEVVRCFGTQSVPPPPILKALPKIFAHTDKTVRADGTLLVHTLYQAIGPAIEPFLADLKPVQMKELHEAFEKMDNNGHGKGTLKPERFTRAQAREIEVSGDIAEAPEEEPASFDPRAFAEEVDIIPKLPSGWQVALASSKWKERKEVLDELSALLTSTPRVKDCSELGDVVKGLTGRMGDANINCVITAAVCIEAMAKALMKSFSRFREIVVSPMLERLKERKQSVADAIGLALDAVFSSTTLPDILPDIIPHLSSKNPQVKEGTMKFLTRCLSTTSVPPAQTQVKPLSESLAGLLEDQFEGARNEAAVALGTLMKIVGERPLNAIMDQLPDVRKVKVKEAFEKATVKCKAGGGAPQKAPAAIQPKGIVKKAPVKTEGQSAGPPDSDEVPERPKGKPPARLLSKKPQLVEPESETASRPSSTGSVSKPPQKAPVTAKKPALTAAVAASASTKSSKTAPIAASTDLDAFKYKHTPEDAEALASELIPANIATDLSDANWKIRLAALDEMTSWVDGTVDTVDSEVVVRYLGKKGWNEKNFQVSAKLYGILAALAERCPSFGKSTVALSVPHLSEKLGDMKLKKPAGDTLMLFAEKTSLQFVLNLAYDGLSKQKAPKVLADSITWIDSALLEFGVAGLSLRRLIDFLKLALANSNAAVRTSATKTLVTVKVFVGPNVKDLLGEINPQLLTTIQTEFDKVDGQAAPEPTRTSADVLNIVPANGGGKAAPGGSDPMGDLFPRVEIDSLLKGTTILADAKSDAWKTKKSALETLQAILDQGPNKRLKPTMGEIGQVLKARVTDTNKAVQLIALDIVARIATGMGKAFEKQTRFYALPLATVLADQKPHIRSAALQALSSIADACEGLESMVHGITTAMESSNPTQRSTLMNWISDWLKEHDPNPSLDLSNWAAPVVQSLDDRNADVRKGAQGLLPAIIAQAGYDFVMQQTNALKPAARASAIPVIKAASATAPTVPKAKPAANSSATAKTPVTDPAPISASPPIPPPTPPPVVPTSGTNKLTGVRRKLPQGTIPRPDSRASVSEETGPSRSTLKPPTGGLKRPVSTMTTRTPASDSPISSANPPFNISSLDTQKTRLAKDGGRFVIESGPIRKDLVEFLQHQMEPFASRELINLLFSHDHNAVNDHVNGLSMLYDFYADLASGEDKHGFSPQDRILVGIANADLALKYVSIRIHEPQPNLISKCLDVVENVMSLLREGNHQLSDSEAMCFVPTLVNKLGDAREAVRIRVQQIIQNLPKIYAFSRVFQLLMDYGLKSKVAKTRQGALEELTSILKRTGIGACDPSKAFPLIASMISDKDAQVRKSALSTLSEAYVLVGEQIWTLVKNLSPKDKTQLEERLRRIPGPVTQGKADAPIALPAPVSRLNASVSRAASPGPPSRLPNVSRPASPAMVPASRALQGSSPSRSTAATAVLTDNGRPGSPARASKLPGMSAIAGPSSPTVGTKPKSYLPSRLGPPRSRSNTNTGYPGIHATEEANGERHVLRPLNGTFSQAPPSEPAMEPFSPPEEDAITLTISKILSSDAARSVDALKQIQKILETSPADGPSSARYRELSDHTEGLVDTITLQMGHVFDNTGALAEPENFRLAKHLIQTLNSYCDHTVLAESLQVDILTALLEELTLRLLQTDESLNSKIKDLSRFINMIILRLFATSRRMTVIRALFTLLLQIVKPFPTNGTMADSKEAKIAELVLKCIWKLARNIPSDLEKLELDPVELFPAIEHFLQSIPPNEWRARATNKVPSGDMPLRTIKVIIQHVVAHYGDDVYDLLSSSFDDPSATIVYPYVYRILNTSRAIVETTAPNGNGFHQTPQNPTTSNQPPSPQATSSAMSLGQRNSANSHRTSPSSSSTNGIATFPNTAEEPDPDDQLLTIISHISSETTGAMHKEGITELHHFLKAYPHKKPRVDKMLESTGPAFRKYIARALASRAADDEERTVAVADTLSKLESNRQDPISPKSPRRSSASNVDQDKLSRLHDLFQYRASTASNDSSGNGRTDSIPLPGARGSSGQK